MDEDKLLTTIANPGGTYGIRTFANDKLQADIDSALAKLEKEAPDSKFAVVIQADLEGAKIVLGRNKGPWTVAAIAEYDWKTKDLSVGAEVIFHI